MDDNNNVNNEQTTEEVTEQESISTIAELLTPASLRPAEEVKW